MTMSRRTLVAGLASLPIAMTATSSPAMALQSRRESRKRKAARHIDNHVDVAVIGAGALGAWTAWHLVRRGQSVRLFDAYGGGNGRAASNLPTMLLDPAQGGDALYAGLAGPSLPAWQNLSETASLPLITPTPVVTALTPQDAAYLPGTSARVSGAQMRAHYPQTGWQDGDEALIGQQGAILAGRRGVLECIADARLMVEDVVMPAPLEDKKRGRYNLPDGGTATHIVYAVGAWLTEVFPQLITPARLSAVRHQIYYFGPGQGDVQFRPPAMPALIDRVGGFSAIPDLEGRGVRLWSHHPDASVDADSFDRRSDDRALASARQWLAQRLPRIAHAPVISSAAAHDCRTSSGDLLMDRFPNHPRVWMLSGGAGRSFALAPAIGERMAAHILDAGRPIEPRWSLPALLNGTRS